MKFSFLFSFFLGIGLAALAQRPAHLDPFRSGARTNLAPFYHGVASGDPLSDRVMIWTRITTDSATVDVKWRIATDTGMLNVLDSGVVTTNANRDFTVKVDVGNLQPNSFYFYEFEAYGKYSLRGRTKTLPVGTVDSIRLAVVSCSNYAHGFFNAYNALKQRNDIDAVLHLGDYIYEYGDGEFGNERNLQPSSEILTLNDYRMRHSYYKMDEDLIRIHQQYPFITIWDDHETANDSWYGGAANHTPGTEGNWFDRKSYGIRAYYEWMPLRMPDAADTQRIYRSFRFGDLIDLYMLDTRLEAREEQNGIDNSPTRTLMGQPQFSWLTGQMDTTSSIWKILGQQVMMAPVRIPQLTFPITWAPFLEDQWDGYPAERQRLYDTVIQNNISNMVVLTGDIHTAWANDLPLAGYVAASGANSAGVEMVVTSVTSAGFPFPVNAAVIQSGNDHVKYADLSNHGYMILDVNRTRAQGDWYFVSTVTSQTFTEQHATAWMVNNGERHLRTALGEAFPGASHIYTQAPLDPRNTTIVGVNETESLESTLLGVYPNPFTQELCLQYTLHQDANVQMQLVDALGRVVFFKDWGMQQGGVHRQYFDASSVPTGTYFMVLNLGKKVQQRVVVKR